jgi:hypothetical protein
MTIAQKSPNQIQEYFAPLSLNEISQFIERHAL